MKTTFGVFALAVFLISLAQPVFACGQNGPRGATTTATATTTRPTTRPPTTPPTPPSGGAQPAGMAR